MVMAATFSGRGARQQAHQLALELRRQHGLEAYVKDEKFDFNYKNGRVTVQVIMDSGTEDEKTYDADILYQNDSADQAILQVLDEDGEKLETPDYLHLLPESRLKNRMKIFAMGFPGGDSQAKVRDKHPEVTITHGHVIDVPYTPGGRVRMVYTDVNVRPGNSGGPVVNLDVLPEWTEHFGTMTVGQRFAVGIKTRTTASPFVPMTIVRDTIGP